MKEKCKKRMRERYQNFKREVDKTPEMESRKLAIILFGPPTSGKSTLALYVSETLHLPTVHAKSVHISETHTLSDGSLISDDIFIPSLMKHLTETPPHGYVFDGIPRTPNQARQIIKWGRVAGVSLFVVNLEMQDAEVLDRTNKRLICPECNESYHQRVKPPEKEGICDQDGTKLTKRNDDDHGVVSKRLNVYEKERDEILKVFSKEKIDVSNIDGNGTVQETSRKFFKMLSPHCFENPTLAQDYFQFRSVCQESNIPFILISGACSYIYWGRRALKDIDVLVPSLPDLEKIAKRAKLAVEHVESSYADSQYLNFSTGVEPVADLSIIYKDNKGQKKFVPFTFDELATDSKTVRFMGEKCTIMSPEALVLFKFCLGRFGIDDYGHHKDDYEDARGVLISQNIDWSHLRKRAKRLGMLERVDLAEKILDLARS